MGATSVSKEFPKKYFRKIPQCDNFFVLVACYSIIYTVVFIS